MLSNENNKIKEFINQYILKQIITVRTHSTENLSTLIDLCLIRSEANILYCEVTDPFIPDQIRYHCRILYFLKFRRPLVNQVKEKSGTTFKRISIYIVRFYQIQTLKPIIVLI